MLTPPRWLAIHTERLTIEPLTIAHPHHIAALNNKKHMRYSDQRLRTHDLASQEVYLRTAGPDCVLLDLVVDASSALRASVGSMSCYLDHLNGVCDMGIMICPEFARKGYGEEAWDAVLRYWLDQGFKVEAGMMCSNLAMICICARTDMEFEGIRSKHFRDGDRHMGLAMWGKS